MSDGGFTLPSIRKGFHNDIYTYDIATRVTREQVREPKPHRKDYNPDGSEIISIPIDTADPPSSPGYQSSQNSTVTSEPSSKMDLSDDPNRPNNKYQQNLLAKIYRDIPKFNELPNEIGASHLQKLCDILSILGISIDDETADEDGDAEMVIRVRVTSLQGAARG